MKLKDNAFIVRWNLRRYGTPPSRDVLPPSRDLLVYYHFLFFKMLAMWGDTDVLHCKITNKN